MPCSRDPKTVNKQIIGQSALFTLAESLSSESLSLSPPTVPTPKHTYTLSAPPTDGSLAINKENKPFF